MKPSDFAELCGQMLAMPAEQRPAASVVGIQHTQEESRCLTHLLRLLRKRNDDRSPRIAVPSEILPPMPL